MSGSESILRVRGARRHYAPDAPALSNADLDLHAGKILALLGPSGSGKSTLLRSIAGLERLDDGEITCRGEIWSSTDTHLPPEQRRVGMVFQDYALFPHMTALANVAFGLRGADRTERAKTQLEAAELAHKAKAYPHELSGGEQQRVALARALAPQPDIVLLDEPFSGLDRRLRRDIRETTVARLRAAGTAALIVTHDADEAFAVADEIALMDRGQVIQTGTPDEVWFNPVSALAARLVGDIDIHPGCVSGGRVETPLGSFDAPNLPDDARVDTLIRPEAITVAADPDGKLVVSKRRAAGAVVEMSLTAADGSVWRAKTRSPSPIGEGDRVSVSIDAQFVRVVRA